MGGYNSGIFFGLGVYPNGNLVDLLVAQTKKALNIELVRLSLTLLDGQG
jgi:hypothetical protein